MNQHQALKVIEYMKKWALLHELSLLIVGSIGYRSALIRNSEIEKCDDIDCIYIYDNIFQVAESPFFDNNFYQTVCKGIPYKADMFSVKITIEGVELSIDFVSSDYIKALSCEEISNVSKYRRKLTNAVEVPDNIYCNFYAQKTTYHKIWEDYQGYRIYQLPIHLFVNGVFFPGVLLSKYLFNPAVIVLHESHQKSISSIQRRMKEYCPADGSWCNAYYKCSDFSKETKSFLEDRKIFTQGKEE